MKKRKRILTFFLALVLALPLCLPASAEGDGNIDGGGGNTGGALGSQNQWKGEDGVRISVVSLQNGARVATFDWSNYDESGVEFHFGKKSKLDYRSGAELKSFMASYDYTIPDTRMPTIVPTSGRNNIPAIKRYFTDRVVLNVIAAQAGLTFDELVGGDYKLLLEPMAYFWFKGIKIAATATEAAYYSVQAGVDAGGHGLKYYMGRLTHQNLPLAMFLERDDTELNLPQKPSSIPESGKRTEAEIIDYLGMGVITFVEPPPPEPSEYDYEFRTNTDVIITFPIHNSGEAAITPDDEAVVTLDLGTEICHKDFICPENRTQLVWVRWRTPSTPQELTMTATGAGDGVTLHVKVYELEEKVPPDPTYYDSGSGFTLAEAPDYGSNTSAEWGEWFAEWKGYSGRHGSYDDGYWWCDGVTCRKHGYWHWYYVGYSASLTARFELTPDSRCQTAYESRQFGTVMPSGYGVQAKLQVSVTAGDGVDPYDVTPIQYAVATFPEFGYGTYNRFLESTNNLMWRFKKNPFSYYSSRVHFTPLWYPDNTDYPVVLCAFDAWTPGGHLYATRKEQLHIFSSCLDDWYIHNVS